MTRVLVGLTLNIQHRRSKFEAAAVTSLGVGRWMSDVGCFRLRPRRAAWLELVPEAAIRCSSRRESAQTSGIAKSQSGLTSAAEVWTFLVPEGPLETSPRFQPWVPGAGNRSSPEGTAEVHSHKYRGSYSTRFLFSKARNSS